MWHENVDYVCGGPDGCGVVEVGLTVQTWILEMDRGFNMGDGGV